MAIALNAAYGGRSLADPLAFSAATYAQTTYDEQLAGSSAHVCAPQRLSVCSEGGRPDNIKTDVTKACRYDPGPRERLLGLVEKRRHDLSRSRSPPLLAQLTWNVSRVPLAAGGRYSGGSSILTRRLSDRYNVSLAGSARWAWRALVGRTLRVLAFVLFCVGVAQAQPYINYRGIVNAASFTPQGPSGSEIAQGSIFSIFGTGLGPATLAQVNQFPLQTSLANVSVQVAQGSNSVNAFPIVVTAGQINVIMPSNAPVGRVFITVTFNDATSNPVTATVAPSSFGIFSAASTGYGPGIVQNFVSANSQPINSLTAAAAPGQAVTLWGTGLGPVAADNVAPTAGNLATSVEVFVGGQLATILYSGRSPCCSGVDQIVFDVPANAPLGCYVPVQVRTNQTVLSNSVTMAIHNGGGACSDAVNPLSTAFQKGGNLGVAVLSRSETYQDVDANTPLDVNSDLGMLTLRSDPGGAFFFNPAISTPPGGRLFDLHVFRITPGVDSSGSVRRVGL